MIPHFAGSIAAGKNQKNNTIVIPQFAFFFNIFFYPILKKYMQDLA